MEHVQISTGPRAVKLTIEDYELLQRSGAFDRYPGVELIEGVVVAVNAEWSRHAKAKNEITYRLRRSLEDMSSTLNALCDVTIKVSNYSLPEPDGIVWDPAPGGQDYIDGSRVRIAIEVADSSRESAFGYKYETYGDHGIGEYWIVDLKDERIHIFYEPKANGYRQHTTIALGERLDGRTVPGLSIQTTNLY
jgi:Uma2 family endonuclease